MNWNNNNRLNNGYWPQNNNWTSANNNWSGAAYPTVAARPTGINNNWATSTLYPNVNTGINSNSTWWDNNTLPYNYSYTDYNGYINGNQYRYPYSRYPHNYPGHNNHRNHHNHRHNYRHNDRHPVLY